MNWLHFNLGDNHCLWYSIGEITFNTYGDTMLALTLVLVDILTMLFGIYWFDYRPDAMINNPFVVILSILGGAVATFLFAILFLEITHVLIAKRRPKDDALVHKIGNQIVGVLRYMFRVKMTLVGRENLPADPKFLIYANHTSELDIPVLMNSLKDYPVAFLAKEAVNGYLSVGKWAVAIGCVMLDRENNRQGADAVSRVIENVKTGSTMVVFPEGTVKREINTLLKFRSGSFKIALEAGVPLVPISIVKPLDYNDHRWPHPRQFTVVVHEPIPYETIQAMKTRELSHYVRDIIDGELGKHRPQEVSVD